MPRLLTPADYRTTPWKNGRGTTTEIARAPAASTGFDFGWRVSMAPVMEDGPFSTFSGVTRTIVVVEGAGMELRFADGARHALAPFEPATFDASAAVSGRLIDGPVRDFNVMVRRGHWRADVAVLRQADNQQLARALGGVTLLHILEGPWQAGGDVPAGHTLIVDAACAVTGSGAALVVCIAPASA